MTPWIAACLASLSFTVSPSLLKLMSMESAMPFNHLILYCPLLLLPSVFPRIGVFSNESALHIRWPKYWSFSMSLCNEYSGLISFRMDWLDLLAVQGTLKSLLQHHSSKASVHIESDSLYILYHQWSDNINTHISQNQSQPCYYLHSCRCIILLFHLLLLLSLPNSLLPKAASC